MFGAHDTRIFLGYNTRMEPTIHLIQVILSIALIVLITIQQKGTGLGSAFGADMAMYRTRRGAEKMLFYASILVSLLLILFAIAGLLV